MQKKITLFVLVILLGTFSCKSNAIDPVDSIIPPDSTEVTPPAIKETIKQKAISYEVSSHIINSRKVEDYFIGSVWDLKDTINSLNIVPISDKILKRELDIWSHNLSVDIERFLPSYQNMTNYAKKFTLSANQGQSLSNGTFFDYAILQIYLQNKDEFNLIRPLFAVNDSTYIRKKNGIMNHHLKEYLTLNSDFVNVNALYDVKYVNELKAQKLAPYYISSVTYGEESLFLAESDSTRVSFNLVLQKLLSKTSLSVSDIAVLDASNLLIYRRDSGSKNTFTKYGKGAIEIKKYMNEYLEMGVSNLNKVDYPLSFTLNSLEDFSSLRYKLKFSILEKI